ncbi:hypothetical protein [Salipiger sp.]|uniref:hypothetical protein n=1 Tax=Salipiger sp. TaxID=2078585 RepID=UPI003A97841E
MVLLVPLESCFADLDTARLMPGERKRLAQAAHALHIRVRMINHLLGPNCPVPDLRRARIADAKAAPDAGGMVDIAALLSRFSGVVPAPPGSEASRRDPHSYAAVLTFPRLPLAAGVLYAERPDARLGVFWRGPREAAAGAMESLRGTAGRYDAVWEELVLYPRKKARN